MVSLCVPKHNKHRKGAIKIWYKRLKKPGTTIKDTWTKPRGRVEVGEGGGFSWGGVEGWGEKAYNCN